MSDDAETIRRRNIMLGLWVSELEPEMVGDALFAPGHSRSTVQFSGSFYAAYSFKGWWRTGWIRHTKDWIIDGDEPLHGTRLEARRQNHRRFPWLAEYEAKTIRERRP